ncbi:MAG TPA: DUF1553 domain-containing protein, partial [Algoriphagus sp.]|nr:DUF1553 domain-containing protein [Algoriphagus sp.]
PSVKPYQPSGLWEAATSGRGTLATYVQDTGNKLYRRGIYNFIKLTVPPPKAIIFDSSNRDRCEIGRNRTNTPLQALVMMNDPMVLEASRVLATKLSENLEGEEAIAEAFKRIVCREMKTEEKDLLLNYYQEQLEEFQANPGNAKKALDVGEYPMNEKAITPENAALMQVIVSMYNLEETITKS